MMERAWTPEILAAAAAALERMEIEKAKLARMTPAERDAHIRAWASRLATEQVEELSRIAKANNGCDCGQAHG
jgi:acyl-CoA reductase-like NAD-dependent aldehyde dehydrogenase